jgi:hypothetical protein
MIYASETGWYGRRQSRKAHPSANQPSPLVCCFLSKLTLLPSIANLMHFRYKPVSSAQVRKTLLRQEKEERHGRGITEGRMMDRQTPMNITQSQLVSTALSGHWDASFFSFWFFSLIFLLTSHAKTSRSHDSALRFPPSAAPAVYQTARQN